MESPERMRFPETTSERSSNIEVLFAVSYQPREEWMVPLSETMTDGPRIVEIFDSVL